MRMPISRVRSVTETSMMFITPMPPTIREMTAMEAINSVNVEVVFFTVLRILSELRVKISLTPCRVVSRCSIPCWAISLDMPFTTRTVMELK